MRKCAFAVVINSGRAEHKAEHWPTNKEQVCVLPPVAASAKSYCKSSALRISFQQKSKNQSEV